MLFKRFSVSERCACIMSVVVIWYVLLSSSRELQSAMLSSLLIIVNKYEVYGELGYMVCFA